MKTRLIGMVVSAVSAFAPASAQSGLFFSEYVEGTSYNKAVEIYNSTGASVDLSEYAINVYFNGAASPGPGSPIVLSGILAAGDVHVVCHPSADSAILAASDRQSGGINFNGDDAVVLLRGGIAVDRIGTVGFDPGTEWGSGLVSTQDNTIRRKSAVTSGDTAVSAPFDPSLEWDGFALNTFDGLGSHSVVEPPPGGGPFSIFHVNDMHGRLTPHLLDIPGDDDTAAFERVGGAACLTTMLRDLKASQPHSLVLDAGDISEGNPLGDLRGNGAMVDFLNLLDTRLKALGGRGLDASVVGNHDVRDSSYINNLSRATYPVLSANVCHQGTHTPYFRAWDTVRVNGVKIGVIGYTTDESSYLGPTTETVLDIVKCVWADSDPATINIRDIVTELRSAQGCVVVVLLAHIGHTRICSGPDALIRDDGSVKPPEAVIAGHWHSMTPTVWKPSGLNGKTIIDEAGAYMQFVARVDFDSTGGYVSSAKHAVRCDSIAADSAVNALVGQLTAEYAASAPAHGLYDTIGYTAADLRLDKDKWWTLNEYPWNGDNSAGAWICDAMRWQAARHGYACDLAIQSGGGIRKDVPAGPVTYLDIYETYPWQDDNMVVVTMTGAQVAAFLEDDHCGASISEGWLVFAHDGRIDSVLLQGSRFGADSRYTVVISEYMYDHYDHGPSWPGTLVARTNHSIRDGIVEYTATFTEASPMPAPSRRYALDTELSGIFDAVVTMVDDNESEPYYEALFVRLLGASPSTVARRGTYVPSDLVNADGSINPAHQFRESMLYRGCLGITDNAYRPGDIIRIKAEGGFYSYNPQLVDEEGVHAPDSALQVLVHDDGTNAATIGAPEYMEAIDGVFDEFHENHYVKFFAVATGPSTVRDRSGREITVYGPGGYYVKQLSQPVGTVLLLSGVQTQRWNDRRFRCQYAIPMQPGVDPWTGTHYNGWPPSSRVTGVDSLPGGRATIVAEASDVPNGANTSFTPAADAQVVEGSPTSNYGDRAYLYVQKSGGTYGEEISYVKFDCSSLPPGSVVTSATLKLYCWKSTGSSIPAAAYVVDDDSWSESGIVWTNRPAPGGALDTVSLSAINTWYTWDVTPFVASQAGGDQTVSLAVRALADGGSFAFDAKEYSAGSLAPALEITLAGSGPAGAVTKVDFFFRHSTDGNAWTAWSFAGGDSAAAWERPFSFVYGPGRYQFMSAATDDEGNVEELPSSADFEYTFRGTTLNPSVAFAGGPCSGDCIALDVSVHANDWDGHYGEIRFSCQAPDGTGYYYRDGAWGTVPGPAVQSAFCDIPWTTVLRTCGLPAGTYTFRIDMDPVADSALSPGAVTSTHTVRLGTDPELSVPLNGSPAPITISTADTLLVQVSLLPRGWEGSMGDCRVYCTNRGDGATWYYDAATNSFTQTYLEVSSQPVSFTETLYGLYRGTVGPGELDFFFEIDNVPDGIMTPGSTKKVRNTVTVR